MPKKEVMRVAWIGAASWVLPPRSVSAARRPALSPWTPYSRIGSTRVKDLPRHARPCRPVMCERHESAPAPDRRRRRDLAVRLRPRAPRPTGASSWSTGSPTSFRARPAATCAGCPSGSSWPGAPGGRRRPTSTCRCALGLPGPLAPRGVRPRRPADPAPTGSSAAIDRHAGEPAAGLDRRRPRRRAAGRGRPPRPAPTLLVTTDPAIGLTADEVDRLLAWAGALRRVVGPLDRSAYCGLP